MNDQKDQIVQKLRDANNILVTVRSDPSVDQLAACIALTLLLNKLNKHATAVYSGKTPSTIEFLKPADTIEKNTDSLRDFIVALDKAKADKLRYKVEDEVVKIFITPYKASISEKDLIFSQGDFNVDVVVALGVHQQQDVDTAITSHGRILHDASVITVNNTSNGELGAINWVDLGASCLSEMVTILALDLGEEAMDSQIATSLLTGIVSETAHFSNAHTTPHTMSVSAALLAAGANQQLVASQIDTVPGSGPTIPKQGNDNGSDDTLKINRYPEAAQKAKADQAPKEPAKLSEPRPAAALPEAVSNQPQINVEPDVAHTLKDLIEEADDEVDVSPTLPEPVAKPTPQPVYHDDALPPIEMPDGSSVEPEEPADSPQSGDSDETLADIEQAVNSPHVNEERQEIEEADGTAAKRAVEEARRAVEEARKAQPTEQPLEKLEPLESLNAHEVDLDFGHDQLGVQPPLEQQPLQPMEPPVAQLQPTFQVPEQPVMQPPAQPFAQPAEQMPVLQPLASPYQPPQPAQPDAFAPLMTEQPGGVPQSQFTQAPLGMSGPGQPMGMPLSAQPMPQPGVVPPIGPNFAPEEQFSLPPKPVSEDSGLRVIQPLPHDDPQSAPMQPLGTANPFAPPMAAPQLGNAPLSPQPLPPNPAANEPAPLAMSPSDQPFTYPMPPAGPAMQQPFGPAPNQAGLPPQGPPPPPVPPPFMTGPGAPGMPL